MDDLASACGERWTRRRFLSAAGLALLAASTPFTPPARAGRRLLGTEEAVAPDVQTFLSRPDLTPLAVTVNTPARMTQPGYVFTAPFEGPGQYGPLILDNRGEPVWFNPIVRPTAMNFRVQRYRGEDVLTWWEGKVESGYGGGTGLIFDHAYEKVARVKGGNGYDSDLHEFVVTSRGTALVAIYNALRADLSGVGGPVDGTAVEGMIQEIDIRSGRVLFEWHSLDHVPLDESLRTYPTDPGQFDYFHLNSIAVDDDEHLLVSARHTSTVYKLDRKTGAVIWRLGGKKSDFAMGAGATFNFQHDARRHTDGTITLFDNGAFAPAEGAVESFSRPLRLRVDTSALTASLAATYEPASPRLAIAMGDLQQLPDGGAFVGWGTAGAFTEFAPDGTVVFDAAFAPEGLSYRAFRYPWVGKPTTLPDVAMRHVAGKATIHVSWNGATQVARWRLAAGPRRDLLRPVRTVPHAGFETVFTVPRQSGYLVLSALDRHGHVLATSKPVKA